MPPRGHAGPASPPVRPEISREFVAVHKRRRIMNAIAELSAEQGYEATKIGDIVRRAGVARKTLYDNFEGKEEVFLAAFDTAVDEVTRRIEEACGDVEGVWEEQVQAGLAAFLGYVAEEPALARMCMIEALSATRASTQRYDDTVQRFVDLIERNAPHNDQLPSTTDESVAGGVAWIVRRLIRHEETSKAMDRLPELSEFMLRPYLGSEKAAEVRANAESGALADSSA